MPGWTNTTDTTNNSTPNYGSEGIQEYRPVANTTYALGALLQLTSVDLQIAPDFMSVQLAAHGVSVANCVGVVHPSWPGFSPSDGFVNTSGTNESLVRGTSFVKSKVKGAAPILIDQSGSVAVTIVNGSPLVASSVTDGYAQGASRAVAISGGSQEVATANLPAASLFGYSITAAALVQASQYTTIATPAAGDTVNITIQTPYTVANPGVLQTTTWSYTLTTADAVSATTAALGVLTYLNKQPNYSLFFTATQSAGEVITTVNALSSPFLVTFGTGTTLTGQMTLGLSGMIANTITFASTVTGSGGTTATANSTTLASGTGYKGQIPAIIQGEF